MDKKELWKNLSQLDNSLHRILLSKIPDNEKILKVSKLQTEYMNSIIKILELEHAPWFPGFKGKKGDTKLCSCCK